MIRPYLDEDKRELIRTNPVSKDFLLFDLACRKFQREIIKSTEWINKLVNYLSERLWKGKRE